MEKHGNNSVILKRRTNLIFVGFPLIIRIYLIHMGRELQFRRGKTGE
jgi:ATP-dependent RNA circularization protein (DNA/RNA ligase family)